MTTQSSKSFERTDVWVFDLDNTLYPSECNLFAQVDKRMAEFIAQMLDVPFDKARFLQKSYYRQYGTTLAGLMKVHDMAPEPFLDYVHDIDLSNVPAHPELAQNLRALPGRRYIFTAGSRRHAERVAEKIGILEVFDDIMDIVATDFIPKEQAAAYDRLLKTHAIDPHKSAMFEDLPHNLAAPHDLGMTTVLVHSSYLDHPSQLSTHKWDKPPDHIHHITDDLSGFLGALAPAKPKNAQPK